MKSKENEKRYQEAVVNKKNNRLICLTKTNVLNSIEQVEQVLLERANLTLPHYPPPINMTLPSPSLIAGVYQI